MKPGANFPEHSTSCARGAGSRTGAGNRSWPNQQQEGGSVRGEITSREAWNRIPGTIAPVLSPTSPPCLLPLRDPAHSAPDPAEAWRSSEEAPPGAGLQGSLSVGRPQLTNYAPLEPLRVPSSGARDPIFRNGPICATFRSIIPIREWVGHGLPELLAPTRVVSRLLRTPIRTHGCHRRGSQRPDGSRSVPPREQGPKNGWTRDRGTRRVSGIGSASDAGTPPCEKSLCRRC